MTVAITLHETDGSLTLSLPPEYAKNLDLKEGSVVDVSFEGQELTARPATRYSMAQLLKEHAEIVDQLDDNSEWINAPAAGLELI